MNTKVADLTVDELKSLINQTVVESLEGFLEDWEAMRSPNFVNSVEEARAEYRAGKVKTAEQVFGDL